MGYKGLEIINDELMKLKDFIESNTVSPQPLVSSAVSELITAGGKRLRPALTILTGKALGNTDDILIPVAASMEIIHMATLVHDDIIDDASVRRSKPTVQSRYGKDVAVFTGDYLFSKSFLIVSQYADKERLIGFANSVKKICEGEIEQFQNRYSLDVSLHKYLRRIMRKTGVLFALSCVAGVPRRNVSRKMVRNLWQYGLNLGMAFQITDDILDYVGEESAVGKPVGNDIKQGVYTLPLIYGLKYSSYKDSLAELLEKKEYNCSDINNMIEIVKLSGGMEFSKKLAERYVAKGVESIGHLKNTPYKETLRELIVNLNKRAY